MAACTNNAKGSAAAPISYLAGCKWCLREQEIFSCSIQNKLRCKCCPQEWPGSGEGRGVAGIFRLNDLLRLREVGANGVVAASRGSGGGGVAFPARLTTTCGPLKVIRGTEGIRQRGSGWPSVPRRPCVRPSVSSFNVFHANVIFKIPMISLGGHWLHLPLW